MIYNKMLLSSKIDIDDIPINPFPSPYGRIIPSESNLKDGFFKDNWNENSISFGTSYTMGGGAWTILLPKNHCTILIGVSNELWKPLSYTGMSSGAGVLLTINGQDILELDTPIGNGMEIQTKQKYIQLDFENKDPSTWSISFDVTITSLAMDYIINDTPYTMYSNAFYEYSNEIHNHGPDEILTF